jgi:hypothetical protein
MELTQLRLIEDSVTLLAPRNSDCSVSGCGAPATCAVEHGKNNRAVCERHAELLTEVGYRRTVRRD